MIYAYIPSPATSVASKQYRYISISVSQKWSIVPKTQYKHLVVCKKKTEKACIKEQKSLKWVILIKKGHQVQQFAIYREKYSETLWQIQILILKVAILLWKKN